MERREEDRAAVIGGSKSKATDAHGIPRASVASRLARKSLDSSAASPGGRRSATPSKIGKYALNPSGGSGTIPDSLLAALHRYPSDTLGSGTWDPAFGLSPNVQGQIPRVLEALHREKSVDVPGRSPPVRTTSKAHSPGSRPSTGSWSEKSKNRGRKNDPNFNSLPQRGGQNGRSLGSSPNPAGKSPKPALSHGETGNSKGKGRTLADVWAKISGGNTFSPPPPPLITPTPTPTLIPPPPLPLGTILGGDYENSDHMSRDFTISSTFSAPSSPTNDPLHKLELASSMRTDASSQEYPLQRGRDLMATSTSTSTPYALRQAAGTGADIRPLDREGATSAPHMDRDFITIPIREAASLTSPIVRKGEAGPEGDPFIPPDPLAPDENVGPEPQGWGRSWTFQSTAPLEWGRTLTLRAQRSYETTRKHVNELDIPLVNTITSNCACLGICSLLLLLLVLAGVIVGALYGAGVLFKSSPPPIPILYSPYNGPFAPGVSASALCAGGGGCCSSGAPVIYQGEPFMPSVWWSSLLEEGAQVQLFVRAAGAWVGPGPPNGGGWTAGSPSALDASLAGPPSPLQVFTVLRTALGGVLLLAPNQLFVALQGDGTLAASATHIQTATELTATAVGTTQIQLSVSGRPVVLTQSHFSLSNGTLPGVVLDVREAMAVPAMRGVNLGGWLVAEEWMAPPLFADVAQDLDGTDMTFQSLVTGLWITAPQQGGMQQVTCNGTIDGEQQTFYSRLSPSNGTVFTQLRTDSKAYWTPQGQQVAAVEVPAGNGGVAQNLLLHAHPLNPARVMIQIPGGAFLAGLANGSLTADTQIPPSSLLNASSPLWSGPTVFTVSTPSQLRGEWQLSSGLGASAAPRLQQHRQTFIAEADFSRMRSQGLNAARVPVGYWIAQGESPDPPFVAGGLAVLDAAMELGALYGVRIFLSMHGAAGSQNGFEHSGSRDGVPDLADANSSFIDTTLGAIDFLAARYASKSAFLGIDLLNEPNLWGVSNLTLLMEYYSRGYDIVRNRSKCAYVGIMARVDSVDTELDGFMTSPNFTNVILDLHEYNTFDAQFDGSSLEFNIDYVNTTRLANILSVEQGSRLTMVGEWSLALPAAAAAMAGSQDYFVYAQTQQGSYGQATAGWFFWSLKLDRSDYPNWSFQQSVDAGWMKQIAGYW